MEFTNFQSKLAKYANLPLSFSKLEISTCTVEGKFTNVQHNEQNLMLFLECDENIVGIDSNFGHLKFADYQGVNKSRKSNRGRKKKPKTIKSRKIQGDGSGFNSQISFTVLGTVTRLTVDTPDKHSIKAEIQEINGKLYEKFTKEFKIKVFRNGKFTVPGVLTENLEDVKSPLEKLAKYFNIIFKDNISIENMFTVMCNYKFHIIGKKIDIKSIQKFFAGYLNRLLNTRFEDIYQFLINPSFESNYSPSEVGWKDSDLNNHPLSFDKYKNYLEDSVHNKNLFIDFNKLKKHISKISLSSYYRIIRDLIELDQKYFFFNLDNISYQTILKYLLLPELDQLKKKLMNSKDNILSHIKYDPEKYPGFLIKIKTPNHENLNKRTTIKIFPSGKINIDGANNKMEAEFIYYWLNYLFSVHDEFTFI